MELCKRRVLYLLTFILWATAIFDECSGISGDGTSQLYLSKVSTVSPAQSQGPVNQTSDFSVILTLPESSKLATIAPSFGVSTLTSGAALTTSLFHSPLVITESHMVSSLALRTQPPSLQLSTPLLTSIATLLPSPTTELTPTISLSQSPSVMTPDVSLSRLPQTTAAPQPVSTTQPQTTKIAPSLPTVRPSSFSSTSQETETSVPTTPPAFSSFPILFPNSTSHQTMPTTGAGTGQQQTQEMTMSSRDTTPVLATTKSNFIETTPKPTPPTSRKEESFIDKVRLFFDDLPNHQERLIALILGPVVVILLIVVACVGCCCLRSSRKKSKRFDLASSQASRNGGVNATYRPRSRASVQELRQYDPDAFYSSDFTSQTASQPFHSAMGTSTEDLLDRLPSISPLSYPSQLRNYIASADKQEHPSSPTPRISLSGSPSRVRKYPDSSPSLTRPTPLGQLLQKQAERNSMQGSRTSIRGSRASISAIGSRTSFSGSRNSFLSSSNTMTRDETRSSGFLASTKTMSEGETASQISYQSFLRRTSLDMVPTRESPVQLPSAQLAGKRREYKSLTCISNPTALQAEKEEEAREEGDGVDENDLRKDPLVPVLTSTPVIQPEVEDDLPTKEAKQQQRKAESSWRASESGNSSVFMSPRKKSLRQLTSLTLPESEEREVNGTTPKGAEGEGVTDKENLKDEKTPAKPMSRLEKLTSLTYNIRSSIRRSLKKKRVSFLTRTPESTPKAKKKTPPRTLPAEADLDPDPLTFSNQSALDAEGPMLSPRIHTPSPISPEFEEVDNFPRRYTDDFYNPDIYPETHTLWNPYPSGGPRMRSYSDMPMFAPQLSQPTYYSSAMHYPQPSYPQLSQQYGPPMYGPPLQPLVGSPSHRAHGPLSVQPTLQQPVVGSPPHHNYGPLSLPPQPLVGSPPQHAAGPLSFAPQPLVGSPTHHSAGPLSLPPQPLVGSPTHHGFGPLSLHPSLHPGLPPEPHGRRYTDSGGSSHGRGRGRTNDPSIGDDRRFHRARSPDVHTDAASNVSVDRGMSPDRFTETSYASEVPTPSPDIYNTLMHAGRNSYMDPPLRHRGIPTSPEENPASNPFYGGPHPYIGGTEMFRGPLPGQQYAERSIDNPNMRSDNYRPGGYDSQVQSPAHYSYHGQKHRRASVERQQGHSRHGSTETPSHSRQGSSDTTNHSRRGSIDGQNHSRRGSIDGKNHSQRGSIDGPNHSQRGSIDAPARARRGSGDTTTSHSRHGSTEATPSHSRQGSHDAMSGHGRVRRSSTENQHPPLASHIRRTSVESRPANGPAFPNSRQISGERRSSVESNRRRTSVESQPRMSPRHSTGFLPLMEPRHRNGMGAEEAWPHSQIDEEVNQYGMVSQDVEWEDVDATPTEHGPVHKAVDSNVNGAKTKVSWNDMIIEHLRTPSDSSERHDL